MYGRHSWPIVEFQRGLSVLLRLEAVRARLDWPGFGVELDMSRIFMFRVMSNN